LAVKPQVYKKLMFYKCFLKVYIQAKKLKQNIIFTSNASHGGSALTSGANYAI